MTTTTDCQHGATKVIAEGPYTGPVSTRELNPAAAGGMTVVAECVACGARRPENRNGIHVEAGAWGPTRAERQAKVSDLHVRARRAHPQPLTVHRDGHAVTLRVDDEGMITASGGWEVSEGMVSALPETWVASAKTARQLHLQAAEFAAEV